MSRPLVSKVASTAAHKNGTKWFVTRLQVIASREGWNTYDAFTKWLEVAACALRNPIYSALGDKKGFDANEERYMRVVKSCRDAKVTMNDMALLLAEAQTILSAVPDDFIGPIFMEVANNKHVGQFFTPSTVSELNARMTFFDARAKLEALRKDNPSARLRISEPACGVGGMVLVANKVLREQGLDPAADVLWHVVDVDRNAINGAYIQLSLTNTAGVVIWGNTLSLEEWESVPTHSLMILGGSRSHPPVQEAAE